MLRHPDVHHQGRGILDDSRRRPARCRISGTGSEGGDTPGRRSRHLHRTRLLKEVIKVQPCQIEGHARLLGGNLSGRIAKADENLVLLNAVAGGHEHLAHGSPSR